MSANRLHSEKSPYLLQHKDNPVHWYPWGDEAFNAARKEGKPIFLSIGYSTCHWCHVMEHDSFEKKEVADVLNAHFISIKVDREERPDVDKIYMDAVVGMAGQGGWPLSVFLTPDLKPFYGGTFFYKDPFIELLSRVHQGWQKNRGRLVEAGRDMIGFLARKDKGGSAQPLGLAHLKQAYSLFQANFDPANGGFGGAPKFPRSYDLNFLLRVHRRSADPKALMMVEHTLEGMARGGIYDHLGGGFARYSTDSHWMIPHFEKMLYDNALLAMSYLEAHQATGKGMYASVAREILDYVLRDMTHGQGGFYSAEDADSEGIEGKFYGWAWNELKDLLSADELDLFAKAYGVTPHGNFEHGLNVLSLQKDYGWEIKQDPTLNNILKRLFEIREKRIHPLKDDKIITAWNGLMIASMAKASRVLEDARYLKAAQDAAAFIEARLYKDGKLLRRYRDDEAKLPGVLEDYAFLIHGLIELYQADFNPHWLQWAVALQDRQDTLFWDGENGGYFYAEVGAKDLVVRDKEMYDGAMPTGNSVSALNLIRLYGYTFNEAYLNHLGQLFLWASQFIGRYPPGFTMMLHALDFKLDRSKEIALVGPREADPMRQLMTRMNKAFLPNQIVAYAGAANDTIPLLKGREPANGKPTFYICKDHTCHKPIHDAGQAFKMISAVERYGAGW